jgi:hypothetical protein
MTEVLRSTRQRHVGRARREIVVGHRVGALTLTTDCLVDPFGQVIGPASAMLSSPADAPGSSSHGSRRTM